MKPVNDVGHVDDDTAAAASFDDGGDSSVGWYDIVLRSK